MLPPVADYSWRQEKQERKEVKDLTAFPSEFLYYFLSGQVVGSKRSRQRFHNLCSQTLWSLCSRRAHPAAAPQKLQLFPFVTAVHFSAEERERSFKLSQACRAAAPLPPSDDHVLSLWSLSLCPKVASGVSGIYTNTTYLIPSLY